MTRPTFKIRIASWLFLALLTSVGSLEAAPFLEFVDPNPGCGNRFGAVVVTLSTGKVVITSPGDDAGGLNAGAVYLFNGSTGALISSLRGSSANDSVGSGGVTALTNGNYLVWSPRWDNGAAVNAGAVTWGSGVSGVNGVVSAANSLVGSSPNDDLGSSGVFALPNGNYVIVSPIWNYGGIADAGAVTWGSGVSGVSGVVSPGNSLVGSTANDLVGRDGVTALSNGNYVISSSLWDNGGAVDAGAVTWGSGTAGVIGTVSVINSLVGSTAGDFVGNRNYDGPYMKHQVGVVGLSNGNYAVASPYWDNGAINLAGAATWGSGTTGVTGVISAANSLVGTRVSDAVGSGGVTALANGNYVVSSPLWDDGVTCCNEGAVTWANGTTGITGLISATNSLVGSKENDVIGERMTALPNGNYLVGSVDCDNGSILGAGALTWGSGTTGVSGVVSTANSLMGASTSDGVGSTVTTLMNGNYVLTTQFWDNAGVADAGAVTWGSGATGVSGVVSVANSLVSNIAGSRVGASGVMPLPNGNYVVGSSIWSGGRGAVTWGSGSTGVSGVVSAANSLVGTTLQDSVGSFSYVTVLSNGNYVVVSTSWDNGAIANAGAVTLLDGTTGTSGVISAANSLVGSRAHDRVGIGRVTALSNGNYVVSSPFWDNGVNANAGAATWGNGTTGVVGEISDANSLVGSRTNDGVGTRTFSLFSSGGGITALANGNYVVPSVFWDNGATTNAGAWTWGDGSTGVTGEISSANSLVGSRADDVAGSSVTALANGNYVVSSPSWDNDGIFVDVGAATWGSGATGVSGSISAINSVVGALPVSGLNPNVLDYGNTFIAQFITDGNGRVRVGPANYSAMIVSAVDIPADQGGWLRLTFNRSGLDEATAQPPIATYGIWRRVPGTLPVAGGQSLADRSPRMDEQGMKQLRAALPSSLDVHEVDGRLYVKGPDSRVGLDAEFPPGTWETVAYVFAAQQAQYMVAVPTLSNAAPNDFLVTSHTTVPSIWFVSDPVTGQSVDNLAPSQPTPFTAAYANGATHLEWGANSEPDLDSYRLYRGSSAAFIPGPANLIVEQGSTDYADVGPAGRYYKLSAVDASGNESSFALLTPEETTEVGEEPVAFALEGARPNPARGNGLYVAFALPGDASARLELLDVNGRRVAGREVGSLGAGRHRVNLAQGRHVAPGVYWVRLTQGTNQQRARVAVID
jgi:hypothetical protein